MKIVINPLDPKSVTKALNQFRKYQKEFAEKEEKFLLRLAELGVSVAKTGYSSAVDYEQSKNITVSWEKTPNGYAVKADGAVVGFVEFGTGIRNREWDNTDMDYTPPAHGTYGKGRGAQPWGWWYYPNDKAKAVHTYGEVPAEAMRLARDEMVEKVMRIAREVWN